MKRESVIKSFILVLSLFLISIKLVLGQSDSSDPIVRFVELVKQLFGSMSISRESLAPWLLGCLLFMVVYSIIKEIQLFETTESNFFVSVIISAIITFLAFLYMPDVIIKMIGPQYSVLGATILTLIPFLIMFYFTVFIVRSLVLGKLAWFVFVVYYAGIFVSLFLQSVGESEDWVNSSTLPYIIGIGGGIVMFAYLGWFRNFFWREVLASKVEIAERRGQAAAAMTRILNQQLREYARRGPAP